MSSNPTPSNRERRVGQLEREHAELIASLPKHSVTAAQLIRIEALEDEIASLCAEAKIELTDHSVPDRER
jgi:hypothetical protein